MPSVAFWLSLPAAWLVFWRCPAAAPGAVYAILQNSHQHITHAHTMCSLADVHVRLHCVGHVLDPRLTFLFPSLLPPINPSSFPLFLLYFLSFFLPCLLMKETHRGINILSYIWLNLLLNDTNQLIF